MNINDTKLPSKPVWFNSQHQKAFIDLGLPMTFAEFVKQGFYEKLQRCIDGTTINK